MYALPTFSQNVTRGKVFPGAGLNTYLFGFNGQIKDDEVYGEGNAYTAEFWEYDPRIARRWNVDPKTNPSISTYAVFANNPIIYTDTEGDTLRISNTDGIKLFFEDASKVFGIPASYLFEYDERGNITFTDLGQKIAAKEIASKTDRGKVYEGLTQIMDDCEVTEVTYQSAYTTLTNPETGDLFESKTGHRVDKAALSGYGGEVTFTLTDNKDEFNFIGMTQNNVFISHDPLHDYSIEQQKLPDSRVISLFHGLGHVLYQNPNEQEMVIEFDNIVRGLLGAKARTIDMEHTNRKK